MARRQHTGGGAAGRRPTHAAPAKPRLVRTCRDMSALPVGIEKEVLQEGNGNEPTRGMFVMVHCTGMGKNGGAHAPPLAAWILEFLHRAAADQCTAATHHVWRRQTSPSRSGQPKTQDRSRSRSRYCMSPPFISHAWRDALAWL
jgi:hypothetical protein